MKRTQRMLVAVLAAGAAMLAAAGPASAGVLAPSAESCDDPASARVFLPWLDVANYVPAPGGDVESTASWTLTGGAQGVAGNEPWKVGGAADASSLKLPAGSSATTDAMCVGLGHPTMRFFARKTSGGLLSTLAVEVLFQGLDGKVHSLPIGAVLGGSSWQPTLPFPVIANLLPILPGEQTPVAFRFTPVGGTWQVDDVYVDPWRFR